MGGGEARRLCPDAVFVPPRLSAYTDASKAVFEVFDDTTLFVEGISVDEAFLDVGGRRIAGTPEEIAVRLRREVRERVGLPISVGVAVPSSSPRWPAPCPSRTALVVPPADELAFLHLCPSSGSGASAPRRRRSSTPAASIGSATSRRSPRTPWWRSSAAPPAITCTPSHNRDARLVRTGRRRRSIGSQRARPVAAHYLAIDAVLVGLVDRHAAAARRQPGRPHGDAAAAFRRLHPGDPLAHPRPGHPPATILSIARVLLDASMARIGREGVTLVG